MNTKITHVGLSIDTEKAGYMNLSVWRDGCGAYRNYWSTPMYKKNHRPARILQFALAYAARLPGAVEE